MILKNCRGKYLGTIGEKTAYKTAINEDLCVGDVVEIFLMGCKFYSIVVKADTHYKRDKAFIMGVEECCNDETGEIRGCTISRICKPYSIFKKGDKVGPLVDIIVCDEVKEEIPIDEKHHQIRKRVWT